MFAWRLCRRPFADLSGEGARMFGGRWNKPGMPMVYLAEHPALAVLEVRVHLDLPYELLPDDYVLMRVDLPSAPLFVYSVPDDTAATGTEWLKGGSSPAIRVPSVLMPHAWNILLNPRHAASAEARIVDAERFRFDPRLWQPLGGEG
jgi:RES domain-containing protein